MSQLKTTSLSHKDNNTGTPNITMYPDGTTSLNYAATGFKNQLINGSFDINQREITDTTGSNLYFVDRWFKGASTGRIVVVDSSLSGFDRALSFSGAADSPIYQSVELPRTGKAGAFSIGSTWTLSCYARCASGGNVRLNKRFVNDTNVNVTDETAETFTLDTNWQRISFTFTIASAPNAANTALQVIFTALTADEVFATGFQLEPGPVATSVELRPIGIEFALCQRYYQNSGTIYGYLLGRGSGVSQNGTTYTVYRFPVEMRIPPAFSTTGSWNDNAGYAGAPQGSSFRTSNFRVQSTRSGSPGDLMFLQSSNDGVMHFDAEL